MKDYYRILGVSRDAEEIVIKAAYKALAQNYHPDRAPEEEKINFNNKMIEINEAKTVLLNINKRKDYNIIYDKENINKKEYGSRVYTHQSSPETIEEIEDWNIALKFYPDLKRIMADLKKVSIKLSKEFQNNLLESKNYPKRKEISEQLELNHLKRFYGDNIKINKYVKKLLMKNFKQAAIVINKYILSMGDSITYEQIYPKIEIQFPKSRQCRIEDSDNINYNKKLKLKRVDDDYMNTIISDLEKKNIIMHTDIDTLFEYVFNTKTTPQGLSKTRLYSFKINGKNFSKTIDELKELLISELNTIEN